jgi:hypothetical protein
VDLAATLLQVGNHEREGLPPFTSVQQGMKVPPSTRKPSLHAACRPAEPASLELNSPGSLSLLRPTTRQTAMHEYFFTAEIHGITLETPFAMATLSPFLRNTSMEQHQPNHVLIRVSKSRTWPEDIALNEATREVEDLLDRLSLIDIHRVIGVRYTGYQDDKGTPHQPRQRGDSTCNLTAGLSDPLTYYALERQSRLLAGKLNSGLTRLHRTAQGMPDGIGKYLLLYGALQVMYGDTQAKVDAELLKRRPDTLLMQGKRRPETIVSHVRNLIAHPEGDIDIQTIARQAEAYCPMLSEIVRDELIRQVQS